jgi:hypothetical protein
MPLALFEKYLFSEEWLEAVKDFDCGSENCNFEKLNIFLKEDALKYNRDNLSRTNIYVKDGACKVYYSLAMASIKKPKANAKEEEKPLRDIPALFLTRLAVDKNYQSKDLGDAVLNNIVKQAYENKEIAARFLFLDAYPESISWYLRYSPLFEILYNPLEERIENYCEKIIIEKLNARLKGGHAIDCDLHENMDVNLVKKNCETILIKHVNDIFKELAPENSLLKICHSKVKLIFENNKPKIKLEGFNIMQNRTIILDWLKNKDNTQNIDITIPLYADINKFYKCMQILNI